MTDTHMMHVSTFYCAGGQCKIAQCVYCVTILNVEHDTQHCFHCGLIRHLCSCDGKTRVESRLNNSS